MLRKSEIWLILATCIYALDGLINYFIQVPLYVSFCPVLLALILINSTREDFAVLLLALVLILAPFFIKALVIPITKDDFSDVFLFVLAFFSITYLLKHPVRQKVLFFCFIIFIAMFIPVFIGIDATVKAANQVDVYSSQSSDIEFYRSYHSGVYRLAHIASYTLFLVSVWIFSYRKNLVFLNFKISWILLGLFCIYLTLYTGSRTPIISFVLSIPAYFAMRSAKGMSVAVIIALLFLLSMLNLNYILEITEGTFFYQYFTFFKTVIENPERLSRLMIWSSWLDAVRSFNPIEFLFGRSLSDSMAFNLKELGLSIWFHNDFLGIFYSYGITGLLLYFYLIFKVLAYKNIRMRKDFFRFTIVFFILFAGLVNGMYKYVPFIFAAALSFDPDTVKNIILKKSKHAISYANIS
ncbi:O-antigen ligase family protein [Pseudomonas silesiensis]